MLDHQLLTRLVLEVLKADPSTQFVHIVNEVEGLAARDGVLPTKEGLNPLDAANIKQVLWDLIVDRVLTPGSGSGDGGLAFRSPHGLWAVSS